MDKYFFTTPFKDDYLLTLGRVTATFTTLEWNIVYLMVGLDGGEWVRDLNKATAGKIANLFAKALNDTNITLSADVRLRLEDISTEFTAAVSIRNSILHGKPATSPTNGQPTFIDKGHEWTIDEISKATIVFQDMSTRANKIYYDQFHTSEI